MLQHAGRPNGWHYHSGKKMTSMSLAGKELKDNCAGGENTHEDEGYPEMVFLKEKRPESGVIPIFWLIL